MKKKYLVDIIIPNYNKGAYIKKSINSVIHQSFKNWKLYIIDDNSTDNSISIIQRYSKSKNINIIKLKKNKGPGNARNIGMSYSKSKYIAFLDSDDFWTKNKLKNQIKYMEKFNLDFTFTDYISFFKNQKKKIKTNLVNKIDLKVFLKNSSINTSTIILKRKKIKNVKFNDTELEDYVFKCKLLKKGIIARKLANYTTYYRIMKNSRSGEKFKNVLNLWKVNKKFNNLSFIENIKSIIFISINSIRKYGLK